MVNREELERAIDSLEGQRFALGDAAVEAAIEGLRRKIAEGDDGGSRRRGRAAMPSEPGVGSTSEAPASARLDISAAPPGREAERRLVTVLFADISGFTSLSERRDPEDVRSLINACFARLVPIVSRYGGSIDKFIGDAIMARFGAPEAHEDDPERALRTALDMRAELEAFANERSLNLRMHFGLNTGLAVAGAVGGEASGEYSVLGDSVNLAARLASAAGPGEILAGEETHRACAALFDFCALDPLSVKGKREPVRAYSLLGLRADSDAPRVRGFPSLSSPIVGRRRELSFLAGRLGALREGEGGAVVILGEAGIGKSRLLEEARRAAEAVFTQSGASCGGGTPSRGSARGAGAPLWLHGQCKAFGDRGGYESFRDIIGCAAGTERMAASSEAWSRLEASVAAALPGQLMEILPALGALLRLPLSEPYAEAVRDFDGEAMGRRLFLAARRYIEALARSSPLVLIFEDLHWMEESSFALLEHILRVTAEAPLLILCTARPEAGGPAAAFLERASLALGTRYAELTIGNLSREENEDLLRNLLGGEVLPPGLGTSVVEGSDGNPYFLEEILRTLMAAGAIVREPAKGGSGERWRAASDVARIAIPDTIQGVIMARVDRLAPAAREALRIAAVIGRNFSRALLRAVARSADGLDEALAELTRLELIVEDGAGADCFSFTHALGQETVYGSLLMEKRKELHARIAETIESSLSGAVETDSALLAYHYSRAESWDKALVYLLRAGDQASRLSADAEALANYREAIDHCAEALGSSWDPLDRAILERKMGEALYRRGEHEKAKEYFIRALDLLGFPLPRSPEGVVVAIARQALVQIGHRLGACIAEKPPEVEVAPQLVEAGGTMATVCTIFGASYPLLGVLGSFAMLNFSERSGTALHRSLGCSGMGYFCVYIGMKRFSGFYTKRALAYAARCADRTAMAMAVFSRGMYHYRTGSWVEAIARLAEARELFDALGDTWMAASCIVVPLSARRLRGDIRKAVRDCRAALPTVRDTGDKQALCVMSDGLAHCLHYAGPIDEALDSAQRAVELSRSVSDIAFSIDYSGELGFVYLRLGRIDEAIGLLEGVREQIRSKRVSGTNATQPLDALAQAYLEALERDGPGRPDLEEKARRACREALRQGRIDRSGLVCAMRYRARLCWLSGKRRAARRWWKRGLAEAERLGAVYEIGMLRMEIGKRLGNAAMLAEAADILENAGAILDRDLALSELTALGGRPAPEPRWPSVGRRGRDA